MPKTSPPSDSCSDTVTEVQQGFGRQTASLREQARRHDRLERAASAANHYDGELAQLGDSYAAACAADIEALKLAIASTAEASMIGVGSGGSFTVASLLCSLHEAYTGRVSRPSTPLEIICSPALAASSPVFLVSAEGKNPDIVEALERVATLQLAHRPRADQPAGQHADEHVRRCQA
jgi:fructoselysine-6-P-deglycase FrlB-like protein